MTQQRDNSGILFRNLDKRSDKSPDYTGTAMIDGVMYYVSAWTKEGGKGKFQSLAFKRKDEQRREVKEPRRQDDDSDLPF